MTFKIFDIIIYIKFHTTLLDSFSTIIYEQTGKQTDARTGQLLQVLGIHIMKKASKNKIMNDYYIKLLNISINTSKCYVNNT